MLDTLIMARKKHPGQRNSLDALCKRYEVDNSKRDYHGALLDSCLLADVYLRMTGGQNSLFPDTRKELGSINNKEGMQFSKIDRRQGFLILMPVSDQDELAHSLYMDALNDA